jgi:hypothetical protein
MNESTTCGCVKADAVEFEQVGKGATCSVQSQAFLRTLCGWDFDEVNAAVH